MFRHLLNLLFWMLPASSFFGLRRCLWRLAGAGIGHNTKLCGQAWVYGRGRFEIGDRTWIGPGGLFYTHHDAAILIGADCDIAPQVMFVTGSHEIGPAERRAGLGKADPITVGDGVWIGARAIVTGGVTIGRGAIVAAGALVIRDVEENCIVGGVPAKVMRRLDDANS